MRDNKKEPFLDRVLLHSKNADERLFDMILRIITFIVLIIIVWIYADLAHVKADVNVNFSGFTADFVPFNTLTTLSAKEGFLFMDNIVDGLNAKGINTSNGYPQGQFISNYNNLVGRYSYITDDFLNTLPIPNNVSAENIDAGNAYRHSIENVNINDNGYYLYLSEVSSNIFRYYVIFTYPEYQWIYGYNTTLYNYADNYDYSNFYANKYGVSIEYNVNNDSWSASLFGSGYAAAEDNCPLFSNDIVWYAYGGQNAVKDADFQEIYEPITSQVLNFNYVDYNNLIGSNTPSESNANHLYFEDVQIGLTGQSPNQDIVSSEIVVGVSVDDWVLNHINDYYVHIAYNFHMKDSYTQQADPDFTITKIVPLRAFMNDGYVYSVYDLFQDGNFLSYYRMINSTYKVYVKNSYETLYDSSIIPTLMRWVSYGFSDYYMMQVESIQEQYNIFDFGLDVTVQLSSGALGGVGNMSYPYTKAFDFLNGSSSITSAEGLRNHNPWLGETTPQANPLVPVSGSDVVGSSGGSSGGKTSVNVNVSGQKVPMNVQTQQEINNTLTNYTNAFETFSNSIRSLADTESQNNFYAVLSNTVPMIPGVNIFLQYVALTCGVMLILLVLKILLF